MARKRTISSEASTALVTGATGGIGREFCELLAQDGYDIVICARHADELATLADDLEDRFGISVMVLARDLSLPSAPEEIFTRLQEESIGVDVLVNCAGFGLLRPFVEPGFETELAMMRVNMVALTHLTKLFLHDMVEQGGGRVLNMGSTASFMPGPLMAVYYATKAYVLSFSQAVASELEGTGVTVTALCPGPTDTGFQDRADQRSTWLLRLLEPMEPETVARAGYRGLMRGRRVVVPSFQDRFVAFFHRFVPRSLLADLVRRLHTRRGSDRGGH
jgi:hypothetical protein